MKKTAYKLTAFLFLGLAMLGVVLPVLPATPFLLVAAWLFAQSSQRWHQWLINSELFGPIIRNWESKRCINCRTKVVSLILMLGMGGSSVFFVLQDSQVKVVAMVFIAIGCATLLSLKTCQD